HSGSSPDCDSGASYESHQGGRVDWPDGYRSGNPAPAVAGISPASVVEWRETPRLVFNPGPTPRIDIGPVSVAIRSPIRRHAGRYPHRSIAAHVLPAAIV